jgi:aryl-alcohol dehydrogenase-like predicted oxidoreductase
LEASDRLVQAGKVRFIGASNHASWRLAEARCTSMANGWPLYCAIEQRYSYLRLRLGASLPYHVCVDDTLLDYCRFHGIALVAYRVLLEGAYTRTDRQFPEQYLGPDSDARLTALKAVSQEVEATPNQVIIAWMRQSEPPILPIIGGSTAAHLSENLGALDVQLTDEQMEILDSAGA